MLFLMLSKHDGIIILVTDISVAFQDVHNQEIKKYGGETIEAPKQLRFKDGGGDLLVELKSVRQGWTSEDGAKVSAYSN